MFPGCQALCKALSTVQVWGETQGEMLFCVITSLGPSLSSPKCSCLLGAANGIQDIQYPVHRVACSDLTREGFTPGLGDPTLMCEGWLKRFLFFQPVSKSSKNNATNSMKFLIFQLSPSKDV